MQWSLETSNTLAALRTLMLNGGWERYWQQREVLQHRPAPRSPYDEVVSPASGRSGHLLFRDSALPIHWHLLRLLRQQQEVLPVSTASPAAEPAITRMTTSTWPPSPFTGPPS